MHLRRLGAGRRVALALHCSLAHGGAFQGLAAALPGATLVAPDLPGHGQSADWDGRADYATLATRQALEVAAGLGPCDLIGHSFGAVIALRMALEVPEAFASLTLIEPVLFAAARAAGSPRHAEHLARQAPFEAALRAGDRVAAARAFTAIWGTGVDWDAMTDRSKDEAVRRIHLIAATESAVTEDSGGLLLPWRLEALGLPVLLVEGALSPPVIGAVHDELARRLPQVGRVVVPGAGHMLPITHPFAVAGAMGWG
jgi:lipase